MFTVTPTYSLPRSREQAILAQIISSLPLPVSDWELLGTGQNPTYKLFTSGELQPRYLLKIPIRKGYPAVEVLHVCYALLHEAGLGDYRIVHHDPGSEIVPHGFFVQPWIAGQALDPAVADSADLGWLEDFLAVLKQVHAIKLPYFGYLAGGPQYSSLQDYFAHMDEVVDHSFGQVLAPGASIWDLARQSITSPGFLEETFATVRERAQWIQSSVEPVLIHGDMLPPNLLYTENGPMLVDWDETRAGWWVYEIARTLYYIQSEDLLACFLENYDTGSVPLAEIRIGIQLEHVRQALRWLCISTFNATDREQARAAVKKYEQRVKRILALSAPS